MDRDVALRIDGYMIAINAVFASAAEYMRNNLPADQRRDYIQLVGKGMGCAVIISNKLHEEHPDTFPKELIPPPRPRRRKVTNE